MPEPTEPTICDVYGCGDPASLTTDGSETDSHSTVVPRPSVGLELDEDEPARGKRVKLTRKAIAHLHVCDRHRNWPHSDDAQRFVDGLELHTDLARHTFRARRIKEMAAARAAAK